MNQSQDYNTDSSKQVLQPNNSIMLTMAESHKRTTSSIELEPPIKRKKEFLVATEKVITNVHNNNSPKSKSICSTTRRTTILNSITAKDDRKGVAAIGKVITNVHNSNSQNLERVYSTTRYTKNLNSVTTKDSSAGTKKETQREISSIACQTENLQILSICNLSDNPKAMKFYTGFKDYGKFMNVFQTLGPDKYDLQYYDNKQPVNLSHLDQFLVVMILLKQHKSHYEISIMFNITLKDIKNIFITWIRFMRLEWRYIKIKNNQKMHQKVSVLNNDTKASIKTFQSSKQDCVETIDVENSSPDPMDCLKKTYKILLNGPANYIESHLAKDIQFVCERLYHFTTDSNGSNNAPVKLKQSTKNIELKNFTRDSNNSNNTPVKLKPPTKNIELKQCSSVIKKSHQSNQKL